jgi:iron(III) transport system substrate-binding protein
MNDKITRRVFLGAGTATLAVAVGQLGKINEVSAQTKQLNLYSSQHRPTIV